MKAVRCIDGRMQLCDVPTPVAGDGQVLVRVGSAGICSSDLHMAQLGLLQPDVTVGHELAGFTADGTPVAVEPVTPCGRPCGFCDGGDYNLCPTSARQVVGIGVDGGMAEYVAVDAAAIVPLPGFETGRGAGARAGLPGAGRVGDACLVEPLAVCVHGLRRAGARAGQRLLVIGGGALGLCAAAAARHSGADVAVVTRHEAQQAAADRLGARIPTPDEAPFDVVVDAAGSPEALALAARRARRGGRLLLLANYWGGDIVLPGMATMLKELRIDTAIMYGRGHAGRDIEAAAGLLSGNPEIARALITHRYPLDAAAEAFEMATRRSEGAIKVVLDPTAS